MIFKGKISYFIKNFIESAMNYVLNKTYFNAIVACIGSVGPSASLGELIFCYHGENYFHCM